MLYQMRSEEELVFSLVISSIVAGHTDGLPPTFLKAPSQKVHRESGRNGCLFFFNAAERSSPQLRDL